LARKRSSYRKKRVDKATRFLIVVSVFFGAIILIGSPLQKYFSQRAQINALQTQVDSSQKALEEARKELELWNDPNYIKSQARARLHFVLPGERQYILTNEITLEGEDNSNDVATNIPIGVPWYTRLIATVTEAGIK
jgi:cell division protein FtsB